MLNLANKKCSECGKVAYKKTAVKGLWKHPWKDFPCVYLMDSHELWICSNCNNVAMVKGDSEILDSIIEDSVRSQIAQFIQQIKTKAEVTNEFLADTIGVSPSYLASLNNKKKTPSFHVWNVLKAIALEPTEMLKRFDPEMDLIKEKIVYRIRA